MGQIVEHHHQPEEDSDIVVNVVAAWCFASGFVTAGFLIVKAVQWVV